MPISNLTLNRVLPPTRASHGAPTLHASPPPMQQQEQQQTAPAPAPVSHPVEEQSQPRGGLPALLAASPTATLFAHARKLPSKLLGQKNEAPAPKHFGMIYPSVVQRVGELTLLRWVNTTGAPAEIQFAQGEAATILSLSVDGRPVYAGLVDGGSPRVDFTTMVQVPAQSVVTLMVRRVSLSGAGGAVLGMFTASSSTATGAMTDTPEAPSAARRLTAGALMTAGGLAFPIGALVTVGGGIAQLADKDQDWKWAKRGLMAMGAGLGLSIVGVLVETAGRRPV